MRVNVWTHPRGRANGRRTFLVGGGAGAAALLTGCGYFAPEQGDAYAPWDFPGTVEDPAELAVRAALLAASPHNTQPWLFAIEGGVVDVYADIDRNLGAMDPLRREMYIGLGCAVENLAIAASHAGHPGAVHLLPDPADTSHVARIILGAGTSGDASLFPAIAARHTYRGICADVELDASTLTALEAHGGGEPKLGLIILDKAAHADFREGTIAATRAILDDAEMRDEDYRWYRHSAEEIAEHRDGITLDSTGLGAATRALGKIGRRPSVQRSGAYWLRNTEEAQTTGSAFVIITTTALEDREQQLRCGRMFQRIHLWATREGLAVQPLNQMAERRDRERTQQLAGVFEGRLSGFTGEAHAQMLFRIGLPWDEAMASPRRPFEWVVLP